METVAVDFMSRIAPAFRRAHKDIVESRDTDPLSPTYGMPLREYWFRGGRGCVDGDTLIETPRGWIKAKNFRGGPVYSYLDDGTIGIRQADPAIAYAREKLYRVTLVDGTSIVVTDEHRFLTENRGWKMAKDLIVGTDYLMRAKPGGIVVPTMVMAFKFEKVDYYYDLFVVGTHNYIANGVVNHNSTKSSFISLEIIRHMVENPKSNTVVFMRIAENIRDSVYKQINWAIDKLELNAFFKCTTSPFKCVYSRTQNFSASSPDMQEIIFRGLDKAGKIKGIKPTRGYFDQIWFEELTEFNGMEDCRSVIQSVLRSGDTDQEDGSAVRTWEFYSYNPPPTIANWVNLEASEPTRGRKVYESNYMNVPPGWLGKDFIERANILLEKNPRAYAHEYLGWITGTGGNIFNNLEIREIPDEEWTTQFNNRCFGIDWGFARDPFVWLAMNFDRNHNTLYIFDEIVALGKRTQETAELVKAHMKVVGGNLPIYADCAEPDSIADYNNWGVRVEGAPKPHGLKWSGRDYEFKALQDLDKIVIDKTHCPYTAKEFQRLEYPKNGNGEFISEYPHSDPGDAARYGCFWKLRDAGLLNF